MADLELAAREKGLALRHRLGPGAPRRLVADPGRLRQVIYNLAVNAIEFTEQGGVAVEVDGRPLERGRVELAVSVADSGIGIPPDQQDRIFQPFTQADGCHARRHAGAGLGLAISRQLVERMGGGLAVESAPGRGATFRFTAVCRRAGEAGREEAQAGDRPAAAGRSLRVSVAEDNPVNQNVVQALLQRWGHQVELGGDGGLALERLEEGGFDLVLMDVQMPGMDGLEATRRLRSREAAGRRLPVVAMTAHALKGDRERCLEAGMDGYLSKPVERPDLGEVLAAVARGRPPAAGPES
jgi:CheY-like chemotaxis protein